MNRGSSVHRRKKLVNMMQYHM